MLEFLRRSGHATLKISEITGLKFQPGHRAFDSPLSRYVGRSFAFHNQGQLVQRDFELVRLESLVRDLTEIASGPEHTLSKARKILRQGTRGSTIIGQVFEIHTCATLLRKGIPHQWRDSPDFEIYAGPSAIECTSIALANPPRDTTMSYKLEKAIAEKSGKPYCSPNTVLFMDISNVQPRFEEAFGIFELEEFREIIRGFIQSTNFGSMLAFTGIPERQRNIYRYFYKRVDNKNTGERLGEFLDQHWPLADISVPWPS